MVSLEECFEKEMKDKKLADDKNIKLPIMQRVNKNMKVSSVTVCLWPCSLAVPVLAGWVMLFVVLCPGTSEGSTSSGSGFKASQKTGQRLKVPSDSYCSDKPSSI